MIEFSWAIPTHAQKIPVRDFVIIVHEPYQDILFWLIAGIFGMNLRSYLEEHVVLPLGSLKTHYLLSISSGGSHIFTSSLLV